MFFQVLGDGEGGWGCCWLVCVMKGAMIGEQRGGCTKVAAKATINTLIAAWHEQAGPVKDMLGHWQGGWGKSFTGVDVVYRPMQEDVLRSMPWWRRLHRQVEGAEGKP